MTDQMTQQGDQARSQTGERATDLTTKLAADLTKNLANDNARGVTNDRSITLNGVANLRDLGDLPLRAGGVTRRGRVLRSDSLHNLDRAGQDQLRDMGLATVIDLRSASEAGRAPNPFNDAPGVLYRNVSLFEGIAPRADQPDQLADMYLRALRSRQQALAEVLTLIANTAHDGTVLFHCAAGKDRTGVTAALVLTLADVPEQDILADYALTAERLAPIRENLIALAMAEGFERKDFEPLLACAPVTMDSTLAALRHDFGSVVDYLHQLDLSARTLDRIAERMTV